MEEVLAFISSYISYWPLVCFFALILAGFNIPVSEDLLIIMSAVIATKDKSFLIPNYLGLYGGIYISDLICYWFGRLVGGGLISIKFVARKLTPARIQRVSNQLEKHGFLTYVVTRFIPFGVRNTLFMTSGMLHVYFPKFMLFDAVAALISSSTLYLLVFFLGESAAVNYRVFGIVLFVIFIGALAFLIIRHELKKRNKKPAVTPAQESEQKAEE